VYKQVVMNAMLQIEREVKKQLTGGSPYRKWRSALACNVTEEEE
jgi:hypothetical protein